MRPMKSPQPWNLVMHAVVPVLGQVIGYAENEDSPEERNPPKDIVLAGKQNREYRQAEPGKEGREYQLGNREAREIKRFFIPRPLVTVKPKRKLHHAENDDEQHEPIAMGMIRCSMVDARTISRGSTRRLPWLAAAEVQRKKHQQHRQRI